MTTATKSRKSLGLVSEQAIDAQVFAEMVTPSMAHQMLATNANNRKIRMRQIEKLAGAMKRGEWTINGETIVFDKFGNLIDGQHRLEAVIKSDTAVPMLIVVNVDQSAQETVDTGAKRTFGDMLRLRGEANYAMLASVVRSYFNYEFNGIPISTGQVKDPTHQQLFDVLKRNPGLRESVTKANNFRARFIAPSTIATLHYAFLKAGASAEDVDYFFEKLVMPTNLDAGDPIMVLRQRLEQDLYGGRTTRLIVKNAYIIKAFNAYMAGDKVKRFNWKSGGKLKERFPVITVPQS